MTNGKIDKGVDDLDTYVDVTNAMVDRDFVSVVDFGAVGDTLVNGTGTDDTVAINAAIAYALPLGKAVYFPANYPTNTYYKITSTIAITAIHGTRLFGDGIGSSKILQVTSGQGGIKMTPISQLRGFGLEGLTIQGLSANRTGNGFEIVKTGSQPSLIHLQDVEVMNWDTSALVDFIDQSTFENCWFGYANYGLNLQSSNNAVAFIGGALNFADEDTITVNGRGISFNGIDIGGDTNATDKSMVKLENLATAVSFTNCSFESINHNCYMVDTSAVDMSNCALTIDTCNVIVNTGTRTKILMRFNQPTGDALQPSVSLRNLVYQGVGTTFAQASEVANITGQPQLNAFNATDLKGSVDYGSSVFNQVGAFPVSKQDRTRANDVNTRGNITWFNSFGGTKHDDLQAVFRDKSHTSYNRTSLFNYHIINPLDVWSAAYPITAASTLVQVATALEALQDSLPSMAPEGA